MSLFDYQKIVQRLLMDTGQVDFNLFDLRDWINIARSQVATEGEAIHRLGTINTVNAQPQYNFSGITPTGGGNIGGVIAVRQLSLAATLLTPREWEWMYVYYVANGLPSGTPKEWAQLGQGLAGTFYLGPTPTGLLAVNADVIVLPGTLNVDTDVESLPYPWTDAVPYFSAYMAFLTKKMYVEADKMFELYERFMMRARAQSTPTVLPSQYPGGTAARRAGQHAGIVGPSTPAPGGAKQGGQ